MKTHFSQTISTVPVGGASRFSRPSRGFAVLRNEVAEPLSMETQQERAARYGHNIQHLRPAVPSSPSALNQSAPIQRTGGENEEPSFFQKLKNFFVPKTSTVKTPEGRDVSVRPTIPSHLGLTPNINLKTWVDDEKAKGHGTVSLSETGDRFHTQGMTKTKGKGVSDTLHKGVAQYAQENLGVIPEKWTSTWTATALTQRGNEHQAQEVETALRKTNPNPTPEEIAKAHAYGVSGAKPVAGAKAKLNVGYLPESYLGGLYTSKHPSPIINTDQLKKLNMARTMRGKGFAGAMLGAGVVGLSAFELWQQMKEQEKTE